MGRVRRMDRARQRPYATLGRFLREARQQQRDHPTGTAPRVEEVARRLGTTASFVYQVEQGLKKPRNGKLGAWASVYGVRYVDLCRCLDRIPMDLVASLKETPAGAGKDPFADLTEQEKRELLPYLQFVRWKLKERAAAGNRAG